MNATTNRIAGNIASYFSDYQNVTVLPKSNAHRPGYWIVLFDQPHGENNTVSRHSYHFKTAGEAEAFARFERAEHGANLRPVDQKDLVARFPRLFKFGSYGIELKDGSV